jgi:hypothetical protein
MVTGGNGPIFHEWGGDCTNMPLLSLAQTIPANFLGALARDVTEHRNL